MMKLTFELIYDTDHNPNNLGDKKEEDLNKWWMKNS